MENFVIPESMYALLFVGQVKTRYIKLCEIKANKREEMLDEIIE